ncbi:hypothetical protein N7528_008877 [Penicillium herquei]|nr:hypothetical protein N7528_008877 [Penicillium herquei]
MDLRKRKKHEHEAQIHPSKHVRTADPKPDEAKVKGQPKPTEGTRQARQALPCDSDASTQSLWAEDHLPFAGADWKDKPPGPWARWINDIQRRIPKTTVKSLGRDAREYLMTLKDIRELTTRHTATIKPTALNLQSRDMIRVQSALIQVKGAEQAHACQHCENGFGPWPGCLVVLDPKNRVSACANCYWRGQQKTCDFYQMPFDYKPRRSDKLYVNSDEAEEILRLTALAKRSNDTLNSMTEVFMSIDQSQSGPAAAIVKENFIAARQQKEEDLKNLFEAIQTCVGPKNA